MNLLFIGMNLCEANDEGISIINVPAGYVTLEEGFWADISTGGLILEGLRSRRRERDMWIQKYNELAEMSTQFADEQNQLWNELQAKLQIERKDWQRQIKRSRLPGLGAFVGIGYTTNKDIQGVAGMGFVFKF